MESSQLTVVIPNNVSVGLLPALCSLMSIRFIVGTAVDSGGLWRVTP
jgi:hypothetical protein